MDWRRLFYITPAMNGGCNSNMTKCDYIPDVVFDILLKLPTKSVLRFKIVCKTWYSLISDPIFISLHSKLAPQSPKILYSTPDCRSRFQLLDYDNSSFDDCCLSGPINFPYCTYPEILGSSSGLVCVATDFDYSRNMYCFCIWNPLTRECRNILNLSANNNASNYFHGLGYDSVGNNFKLVVSIDRIRYNIFSLKEDSWKTITCPLAFEYYHPHAIQDTSHNIRHWHSLAIVLNGVFHWLVTFGDNDGEIVAFDVGKETFKKLQLPQQVPQYFYKVARLLEHRGCLCISVSKQIWMMKEYGVWIHSITIKNSPQFDCFDLPVLCISTSSEVVYHTDEKFSRCAKEEEDKLNEKFAKHRSVQYVETLVSPYTENMKETKKLKEPISYFPLNFIE